MSRGVLIDVGANVGMFTLLVADKIDHAILFEPNPIAATRAEKILPSTGYVYEVQDWRSLIRMAKSYSRIVRNRLYESDY